jgi:glycine cleavage system H protein
VNGVDLPPPGTELAANAELVLIDAQKVALSIPAPLAMHVIESNHRLSTEPMLVRTDPEGNGWLLRCRLDQTGHWDTLLDEVGYHAHVEVERRDIENIEPAP